MTDDEKSANSAFKNMIHRDGIVRLAEALQRAYPALSVESFVSAACSGLEALELKARVLHLVSIMERSLPTDPTESIRIAREASRNFERDSDSASFVASAWPLVEFVGKLGLLDFDNGMEALREMTSLFSAEFAIRGLIAQNPERALAYLSLWTKDDDPHVRRLVSEGTRPRLPWGIRLSVFGGHQEVLLKMLTALVDDDSDYVRRSVSNHLNDLSKDHPELVLDLCERWLQHQAGAHRQWVVRRGLRTLVKQGNMRALTLVGCHADANIEITDLVVHPQRLTLGDTLKIRFRMTLTGTESATVGVDYRLGPSNTKGGAHTRQFRLKTVSIAANSPVEIEKNHRIRQVTTRKTDPGPYFVSIVVNGKDMARTDFEVDSA